jgi:hypothetical protein
VSERTPRANVTSYTVHDLKTWPEYYDAVEDGRKTFELRKNDRNFRVGDVLHLQRYDLENQTYTGAHLYRSVTYLIEGESWGLAAGVCVMSLAKVRWLPEDVG